MSEASASGEGGAKKGAAAWPLWKKLAFSIAALCVVAGVGIRILTYTHPKVRVGDPTSPIIGGSTREAHLLQTGLVAGGTSGSTASSAQGAGEGRAADDAGPILTQSGLAFFAAFSVGAALRFLARTAVVAVGLVLLCAIGLSAAGILPPLNWAALEGPLRSIFEVLQTGVGKIEGALTHALPSGTMAGLGLAAGLKKGA